MPILIPGNPLEHALDSLRSGLIEMSDFLHTFIYAEIVAPTGTEPQTDGSGFTPLLYESNGLTLVAAFTSMERVHPIAEQVPACLVIQGGEFLYRIPSRFGLVINPGWSLGMEMTPDGIRQIVDNTAETVWES